MSFRQDAEGDWVARLECGHDQHVRHRPPFQLRPWVEDATARAARVGTPLDCPLCDRGEPPRRPGDNVAAETAEDEGGDPACLAGLVCDECGAVVGPDRHLPWCHNAQEGGAGREGPR